MSPHAMVPTMLVVWTIPKNERNKAIAEEKIAGRVTPEMLAVLCLYGLSSANATLRALNIMMNAVGAKNRSPASSTLVVISTAGRNVIIARMYPDTALVWSSICAILVATVKCVHKCLYGDNPSWF